MSDGDIDEPGFVLIGIDCRQRPTLDIRVNQQHALRCGRHCGKREGNRRGVVLIVGSDDKDAGIADVLWLARTTSCTLRISIAKRDFGSSTAFRAEGRSMFGNTASTGIADEDAAVGQNSLAASGRFAAEGADSAPTRQPPVVCRPRDNDAGAGGDPQEDGAHGQQQIRWRETAALRQVGPGDHADVLGVQSLLLAGLAGADQKRFIDRAARLHVALKLAQRHHGLVGSDCVVLERFQVIGKRPLVGACALVFATRRKGDAMDLVLDHPPQPLGLGLDLDNRRVALAERGHLFGFATHDLGVLAAQRGDGLRLHRLRKGADLVFGHLQVLDLVETRFRSRRACASHSQLIVQLRELLFVDELSARTEDVVACLERLELDPRPRARDP